MAQQGRKILAQARPGYERLEDVIGCKWSVSVLEAVRLGINRPGSLEAHIEGISTKVLSERLRKLTDYGLLDKRVYAEVPPRTEYALTRYGAALGEIISRIQGLEAELGHGAGNPAAIPARAHAPANRSRRIGG